LLLLLQVHGLLLRLALLFLHNVILLLPLLLLLSLVHGLLLRLTLLVLP
jgi:hypothetical protein